MKTQKQHFKIISSTLFFLLFIGINISVISQNLVVEQDFTRVGTCLSPDDEACVTIIASRLLSLTFESNVDSAINIALKKQVGQNIEYTIYFPTDKLEYFDRILTVYCQSFAKGVQIRLKLRTKESELYYVSVTECYKLYLEKGLALFRQCSYFDAKEEFRKAQEDCSDAPPNDDVKNKIIAIDSIIKLKKLAKDCYEILDFKKAEDYYSAIVSLNKDDNFAYQKMLECRLENSKYCQLYVINARNLFDKKEFVKAEMLYKKIIENGCPNDHIDWAKMYLEKISKKLSRRKHDRSAPDRSAIDRKKVVPSTVFTLQWAYKKRFGFSIGGYPDRKVSAYFTFLFNSEKIYAVEEKLISNKGHDFDATLGITIRPIKNKYAPLWLAFGAGYSGLVHSVSPEIGILAKIPFGKDTKVGLALSYHFKYRAALLPGTQKYVPAFNHIVGIGFCF